MHNGIAGWLARRARRKGEAIALVDGDTGRTLSYAQLDTTVSATAAALHSRGVRRGDRVALLMENSIEFVQVMFGATRLGAIAVPINCRLNSEEVAYILDDSQAVALAVSPRHDELAISSMAASREGSVQLVIGTPSATGAIAAVSMDAMLATTTSLDEPTVDDDAVCMIMYTSGTTGRPKGAMLTHNNMLWNAINSMTVGTGYSGATTTLAVLPMFHMGAIGVSVLPVLYAGGTVVTVRAFDPRQVLELFERHRVTTQLMVPAMWSSVSQVADFDDFDTSSIEFVMCGGAPCPVPLIKFFTSRGWKFMEGYGMTEGAPNMLILDPDHIAAHAGTVGHPYMHIDYRIVDENGDDVAVGEVGELLFQGPNLFVGYWRRPEATAEALRDGWFHTGDLARSDADGFVTIVDRKKDMIITGGENVYAAEVEQAIYTLEGVAEAAVVAVPDHRWGESVHAVIVIEPESDLTEAMIISHCRDTIAHFKCPRSVSFVDELPRNATGKVLKRELRAEYAQAQAISPGE